MQTKAQKQAWYARNKTRVNAARRAKAAADRDTHNTKKRAKYAKRSPETRRSASLYMYSYGLRRRFKISLARWLSIFALQGERCACCKRSDPGGKRWHTDHDHETGHIRGILCHRCNLTLGQLGDRLHAVEDAARRFADYLKGAEPVWVDNGALRELRVWEPKAA